MENLRTRRLRKLISEEFNGSQSELSARTGISLSQLGQYLSGYRNLGEKTARKIELACKKNVGWLDSEDSSDVMNGTMRVIVADENNPDLIEIRKVKLRLSAGISGFAVDQEIDDGLPLSFRKSWFDKNGYSPDKLVAVKVKGESMETTLYENDTVVVNTADRTPKDGEVFAVNYEGEAVIKRMVRDIGQWWLSSDNPDQRKYHRKVCQGEACIIIGKVVHRQSERI